MEQNVHQNLLRVGSEEILLPNQKNNISPSSDTDNTNGCFDCNICLDSANDPIVTQCGHLYCWPCIYKWLNVQTYDEGERETKCPVCKAQISQSSLVPLYGRGNSEIKKPQFGITIPRRPPPIGVPTPPHRQNEPIQTNPFEPPHLFPNIYGNNYPSNYYASNLRPTVGMFGEMVFARMFGSENGVFPYPYLNNNHISGNGGQIRIRRQEMQLDKSLNRVSIFLFCCLILCLLLF